MAGRAPPFSLNPITQKSQHYSSLMQLSQGCEKALFFDPFPTRLRTPTQHVHGLRDGGLELHRNLLEYFASPAHTRLVGWMELTEYRSEAQTSKRSPKRC